MTHGKWTIFLTKALFYGISMGFCWRMFVRKEIKKVELDIKELKKELKEWEAYNNKENDILRQKIKDKYNYIKILKSKLKKYENRTKTKKTISLTVDTELYEDFSNVAKELRMTKSSLIESFILKNIDKLKEYVENGKKPSLML